MLMGKPVPLRGNPAPSLVTVTHAVYALHALSLVIGITTAATIIGAFVVARIRLRDEIAELDLNPVVVLPQGQGAFAVDALAVAR